MRNPDVEPTFDQAHQQVLSEVQRVINGQEKEALICRLTPVTGVDDQITFPVISDQALSFGWELKQKILREIGADMTDEGLLSGKSLNGRWREEVYRTSQAGVHLVLCNIQPEGNEAWYIRHTRPS